ncbi:MAG: helix-turn-helix domain-containing protein [Clostridia bacterium]|nr:helix-turn-helix domain-containing protein [Clostridia bacterium]
MAMFDEMPDILNLKQCQQVLQIGRCSMLDLIYNGDIRAYKFKGAWRVPKQELQQFVRRLM